MALRLVVFGLICFFSTAAHAADLSFDHSVWEKFLQQYVNDKGEVRYAEVCRDRALDAYLQQIAPIPLNRIHEKWVREEQLAFWLNVYHAGIIQAVCERYPVKSIQNIPGVWEMGLVKIGRHRLSLNHIRNVELLGAFHDEKIHAALSFGARSAPRLRREVFTGKLVEGQLFQATREFLHDSSRNLIDPADKKIRLSRIFEWYARDFRLDFGVPENDWELQPDTYAVLSFISHYLEDADKINFLQQGNYKVKYLTFDWSLNEWAAEKPSGSPASS